jgi:hypothetical protein
VLFYVYRWIRLDTNTPFYVGKGKGNRFKRVDNRNNYFKNIYNSVPTKVEIFIKELEENQAFNKEIEFINIYKGMGYCEANLTNGGEGLAGMKFSEKHKLNISISSKGKNKGKMPWNHGKQLSEEIRQKIAKKLIGKKASSKTCAKLSQIKYGKKVHSESFKQSLKEKFSKQVLDIKTNKTYKNAKEAAIYNNIPYSTLKAYLNGNIKTNPTPLRYI